jgi:hypothetical protein
LVGAVVFDSGAGFVSAGDLGPHIIPSLVIWPIFMQQFSAASFAGVVVAVSANNAPPPPIIAKENTSVFICHLIYISNRFAGDNRSHIYLYAACKRRFYKKR